MLTTIATLTIMNIIGGYIATRKKHNIDDKALDDLFEGKLLNIVMLLCVAPFLEECVFTLAIPMILRDLGIYHDYLICVLFGLIHISNGFFILNRVDLGIQVVNAALFRYVIIGHHFYACVFLHYYFNMMGVVWVLFWTYVLPKKVEILEDADEGEDEEEGEFTFQDCVYLPERSRSVDSVSENCEFFSCVSSKSTTNQEVITVNRTMSRQLDEKRQARAQEMKIINI